MCPLLSDEKRFLLQIARSAIEAALTHGKSPQIASPGGNLAAPRGAFVTLHRNGRLRGCIGRVLAAESLACVVAECAIAAATGDPRFYPLRPSEVRDLQIEVSALSIPKEVSAEELQPGIHGAIISRGEHRGILLPQVAVDHGWARERFLDETCEKAGLPPGAWHDSATRIEVFTAEVFSDSDFRLQAPSDGLSSESAPHSSSQ